MYNFFFLLTSRPPLHTSKATSDYNTIRMKIKACTPCSLNLGLEGDRKLRSKTQQSLVS